MAGEALSRPSHRQVRTQRMRQTTPVSGQGGRGRPRWDIRLASVLLGVGFSYRTEEQNPQVIASIIEPILGLGQYSAVSTSAEVYRLHDHSKVSNRLKASNEKVYPVSARFGIPCRIFGRQAFDVTPRCLVRRHVILDVK